MQALTRPSNPSATPGSGLPIEKREEMKRKDDSYGGRNSARDLSFGKPSLAFHQRCTAIPVKGFRVQSFASRRPRPSEKEDLLIKVLVKQSRFPADGFPFFPSYLPRFESFLPTSPFGGACLFTNCMYKEGVGNLAQQGFTTPLGDVAIISRFV